MSLCVSLCVCVCVSLCVGGSPVGVCEAIFMHV